MIETLEKLPKAQLISELISKKNILQEKEICIQEKEICIQEKELRIQEKEKAISNYQQEIENLKYQLAFFQKQFFGQKKETHKTVIDSNQTSLFEETVVLDLPQDNELQQISYSRRKATKKRTDFSKLELPADLPRKEIIIEPADKTDDMVRISEEVTELLGIIPQQFYVKKIIRPKYALPNKQGITIAELPARTIPGGKVDESLLAFILLYKYVYHLPLYRQVRMFAHAGMKLDENTLGDWIRKSITQLEILYKHLVHRIKHCDYLQVDETTMKVLDKTKKNKTHLGWYWVYHNVEEHLCVFDYHPSRGQIVPVEFLNHYEGVLQTDGYSAYDALGKNNPTIVLVGCMAHARRKFFEAAQNHKELSETMLELIQELYAIEEHARTQKLSHNDRLTLRKEKSKPILEKIKLFLDEQIIKTTPKSPIGAAIIYMKSRWEKLTQFVNDGKIEIDNNLVENVIRPVALGRKNYLFAGSHPAAQRGAIIYSFFACCKMNNLDPLKWLEDVLRKLPETKTSQLDSLLPTASYTFS